MAISRASGHQPLLGLTPATAASFRAYGLIAAPGAGPPITVNRGTARRHDLGSMGLDDRPGTRLVASIYTTRAQELPLSMAMLERHPCSAQAIIGMQVGRFVLVACLSDGSGHPLLSTMRAFLFQAGSGAIYHQGVWHHPIIGLDRDGLFFVQSWQDGSASDCQEVAITPYLLKAEPAR